MSTSKRLSLLLLFILVIISVIDDLSKQQPLKEESVVKVQEDKDTGIAHIKIKHGDTILSVTEEINELDYLDVQQVINDFEKLNPGVDTESLLPNSFYYFPLYNEPQKQQERG
ncbi:MULTISPECIES: hypothetical protein [Oceanobacillus]|uniref:LysM domain-containing protein n=1 Tax=Oceanobacillus indicireducens TaxID=1004261 RepID=A0A917Y5L7_9BACI|nr:hypothetical protein [Oceanobacillus indicireducens]GGN66111.1 hypothetical protein GCM10007971_35670 [Oceanobacillus indicireducens]